MQLTSDQVRKIAKLARLHLTDSEVEMFAKQLSDVFSFAVMLNEVDTTDVEPIAQITGLKDIFFVDEVMNYKNISGLLSQSPQEIQGNMIKVKNVFE